MKCPRCGNEVKEYENEKYCSKCGFPINTPASAALSVSDWIRLCSS